MKAACLCKLISKLYLQKRNKKSGSLYSVGWNGPLDYWNGLLEHACHKFEVSMTIVHLHACRHACTAKKERLF